MEDKKKTRKLTTERELALAELERIEKLKGMIDPHEVVRVAADENNPLHRYLEWDDAIGGEKYRLMQARVLITEVKVEFEGERKEAYFNVTVDNNRGYVSRQRVLSDGDMQRQVLKYAAGQLRHWQQSYQEIQELQGVINEDKLSAAEAELNA